MSDSAAAAAAAARASTIESFTLYSVAALTTTFLRTFSRVKTVGFANLRADDYLIWVAFAFYTAQTVLAYDIGALANGYANNGLTAAARAALSPSSTEYAQRVLGSKIQVAGWTVYSTMMMALKMSMLVFYTRLTDGLGRRYRMRMYVGYALVLGAYVACLLALFLGWRPFRRYWQVNPDPGNACQPAIANPIVWSSFAANLSTDVYLILIPIPILWESSLKMVKKITATFVLGLGIFVLVAAMLKTIFVSVDPVNGAELAGQWGTRETFVAVVTTNLPMLFNLVKGWLVKYFPTLLRSSKNQQYPSASAGFRTIGGGQSGQSGAGRRSQRPSNRSAESTDPYGLTFTESEERIMKDDAADIKMQSLDPKRKMNVIVVRNEFHVSEARATTDSPGGQKPQVVQKTW